MPNEERMTINERRKYLRLIKKRYLQAGKLERGRLLDEMEAVTRLHRKSLIRLMWGSLGRKVRHK
ncbi:MAG TPA: integrase, partial [Anaerolineae bacterium]|nr:integrase [Anaerolineae bacterium]